jgi:DNA-binding NtrC family response regulator
MTDIKIVIFAKSRKDRDRLRNQLKAQNAICLFFEKEAICFDNLDSIRPDIVVLRTDSKDIVWRFLFAAHTLKFAIRLLVISDVLDTQSFEIKESGFYISTIEKQRISDGLWDIIQHIFTSIEPSEEYANIPFFVGDSAAAKRIRSVIPNLKRAHDPILISGESGTGKKLIAKLLCKSIHSSDYSVKLDCESLSMDHNRGALHFHIAQNGNGPAANIFLGGIDKASKRLQSEILAIIDGNGKLGNKKRQNTKSQFCLIATSTSNLEELTQKGQFRKDLFFRLNVIPLEIPPLRERKEDIALLADFFILQSRKRLNKSFMTLSSEIKQQFILHDWPGNVNELRKIIHEIAIDGDEEVVMPKSIFPNDGQSNENYFKQVCRIAALPDINDIKKELDNLSHLPLKAICDKFITQTEKKIMQKALETTNWNRKKAASLLNISYKSMLNKMKMYEIV